MRILVTGGAGYIGSVVTDQLLAEGHDVIIYDNLSEGHVESIAPAARLVRGDLRDGTLLRETLTSGKVEAVIQMAADALVGESVTNPRKYYDNNLGGSISLLDAMVDCGVRKLVFSSTCAVYGPRARFAQRRAALLQCGRCDGALRRASPAGDASHSAGSAGRGRATAERHDFR